MLDKSIPYKHVLMKRPKGTEIKNYELPIGYTFCFYKNGYQMDWSEIETAVLEFDNQDSALQYYNEEFMPYLDELERRQIFVRDPKGNLVATATSWWTQTTGSKIATLHWVAVKPEHQGKRIGKAIVSEGIRQMVRLDGDVDIYLHTQTWSYKAINIYLDTGFEILKHETFGGYKNEYEEAVKVLEDKVKIM